MTRFVVTASAERDILQIVEYISRDNETAAARFHGSLIDTFGLLASQPLMGQRYETPRTRNVRFHTHGKYVIFYRPLTDGVRILRVIHGARDYEKLI